jgi:hypothetical protein
VILRRDALCLLNNELAQTDSLRHVRRRNPNAQK